MKTMRTLVFLPVLALLAAGLGACRDEAKTRSAQHAHEMASETREPGPYAGLRAVESKYVCMVNNQVFSSPQIPVEVDGKTYYGCCPACKATLEEDASMRTAVDPVSGVEVDKALAAIGAFSDGSVLYFENAGNRETFARTMSQ